MEEAIRLNKYLSDAGVCSRREADRLIEAGKVLVDGQTASMGMKVAPGQTVVCDGKTVGGKDKPVFLAVNKPRGIVCTTSDKDQAENIVEFLNYPQRIYPVGRLDKDSEGLLLMTNQGDIPMVGNTASRALGRLFGGNLGVFENAVHLGFDFTQLPDFGETMHHHIHEWFCDEENL